MRILLFFLIIFSSSLPAQDKLGESEIKDSRRIDFKNKNTKRAAGETKSFHENIGKRLAGMVSRQPTQSHELEGVRVQRVVSSQSGKFGGDILYLDSSTNFGHINSLHRILSGYIQASFEYSEDQADILSLYTLYYNAMNRGRSDYILSKYTPEIEKYLSKNLGIGTSYKEWPGRTEIVLPIERNILKKFDKDVTLDELEEQVGKIIDEKKSGKEEKEKFEEFKRDKIESEKEAIDVKKEELTKLDDLLDEKYKKIDEKLSELKKDPNAKKEDILKLEKEKSGLEKKKEDVEKKIERIEEREDRLAELEGKKPEPRPEKKKEESETVKIEETESKTGENKNPPNKKETESETVAAVPSKEVKEEKLPAKKEEKPTVNPEDVKKIEKELAETKKELEAKKEEEQKKIEFSPNVLDGKILFIKPVTYIEGQCNNELHALDPAKDDFIYKSEFNQICGKVFKDFGGNILVVGFKEHKDQIRLVLLSRSDLKPIGVSEVDVYQKTILEVNDSFLYAVEVENGKHYLSKFDRTLKRLNRTDQEITPDGTITFYSKKIYVSGKNENGKVEFKIFNRDDLKFIKKTQA